MRTRGFRMRNRASPEINMGAFSDIAFQLIIFFMVCTSFNKPKAQEMELPNAEEPEPEEQTTFEELPTISLFAKSMRLNNKAISRERLREWLDARNYEKIKTENPEDTVVILQAQPEVDYARFYDVVSLVDRYGGTITILEEEKDEDED